MLRVVLYKKTQLIDGEIATLQARTSTMSSAFDR
jgi:hypothetical protein